LPLNAKTKKPYQGINITLLWLEDRFSPYWATKKVWQELGATILPDETPTEIYFCAFATHPVFKVYEVFNLTQVRGCDLLRYKKPTVVNFKHADSVFINSCAAIYEDRRNDAYYDCAMDEIHCPCRSCFHKTIGYYTTKLHELAHWTGHFTRLKRVFGRKKDSMEYAYEELVAELTSCFMAASLEIPEALDEMPQHVSYIRSWLAILENDTHAIFRASASAQKATKYLMQFASIS